jgi:hypothetical protein
MLDHAAFSQLRMRHLFPTPPVSSFSLYDESGSERRTFYLEYQGGTWDTEEVNGVKLYFPAADGTRVGIVEVASGPYVDATGVEGFPRPFAGPFLDPVWTANANVALAALDLPVRIGSSEADVRALATGQVQSMTCSDGVRTFLRFAWRVPDLYYVNPLVHAADGLLKLEIFRPDLVKANDHDGGFRYFKQMYRE